MKFFCHNFWAIILTFSFLANFILACLVVESLRSLAIVSSLGTGVSAIYAWIEPILAKPFEKIYSDRDWKPFDIDAIPEIIILASLHKKGTKPKISFQPIDSTFGMPNSPWDYLNDDGDIVIRRPNNSTIRPFSDFKVRITK
jgi:hypothetical protein